MIDTRKFRAAMVEAGYTQSSLSKTIGWTPNTTSAKINNKRDMTVQEAKRICELFSIVEDSQKVAIFFA